MAEVRRLAHIVRDTRPMPPAHREMVSLDPWFEPDQDGLGAWARRTFIDAGGALENDRHQHLRDATIGWLWTNAENRDRNRTAAATCQLIGPPQAKWPRERSDFQLREWFGLVPDFLITVCAPIAAEMDDWAFCALVEHELCHAAQDQDPFGSPRFTREGKPIFRLVGHDVEEFVEVVARYGADATGTRALVTAANAGPSVGAAQMAMACGTCMQRRA